MNNGEHDNFITALNYFTLVCPKNVEQYSIRVCMTTPLAYLSLLRTSPLKIEYYYPNRQLTWRELVNIITNVLSKTGIPANINIGSCVLGYCQLMNIPLTIHASEFPHSYWVHRHRKFDKLEKFVESSQVSDEDYIFYLSRLIASTSIMELDNIDIDDMTYENKEALYNAARISNDNYTLGLLKGMDNFPLSKSVSSTIISYCTWIPFSKRWILDQLREDPNNEHLYTDVKFDDIWKSFTPQQIIEKEFNPEHLRKLGITVPDIDLVLSDITNTNILTIKRSLRYSNPSQYSIELVLDGVDKSVIHCLEVTIILVQRRRELMNNYRNHPFVAHLLDGSSTEWVKTCD